MRAARGRTRPRGKIFIVSAPSGSGKTTLCKRLLADSLGLIPSISVTTRPPRAGEKNGVDYRFVSRARFDEMAKRGGLLEYEENFGRMYGTPRRAVERCLNAGASMLVSIDVKGAMKVRAAMPDACVLIFIMPPSIAELKRRLLARKSDGAAQIATRLAVAKREMTYRRRYDHTVVNDRLDSAYRKLRAIILSECDG